MIPVGRFTYYLLAVQNDFKKKKKKKKRKKKKSKTKQKPTK